MKNIKQLAEILNFNPAKQWHSFLTVFASMLAAQLRSQYPGYNFNTEVEYQSVSAQGTNKDWKNYSDSDRISLKEEESGKVCLKIILSPHSRHIGSTVQVWFLDKDGSRMSKGQTIQIPRANLGTYEFTEAAANWLFRLEKPNIKLLGAKKL